MKKLLFLTPLFFFFLPIQIAHSGQWYTSICKDSSAYNGIAFGVVKNVTQPKQGIPSGAKALECDYRGNYNIGKNFSRRFFGIEQKETLPYKSSLAWEWEDMRESVLFELPDFVTGKIYLRARNNTQACLWARTDFFEKYAWSCVTPKGIKTSSRFGALLRPSHNIKIKRNKKGQPISRSGFFDIVPGNLEKINNEVFGTRAYNISIALGIQCTGRKGCSAKGSPQMIWRQLNFLNKETKPPYINPAGYNALQFPATPDAEPLVRVEENNINSLAGELKCPIQSESECIESYGSQIIGATDQPLFESGAGIYSIALTNNKSGSQEGTFESAKVNGSNSFWQITNDGSYLFQRCVSEGFLSSCQSPVWGLLNFEIRSVIDNTSYNLNGANRLQVCAYDRKEIFGGVNEPGLETCVIANDSFILDNEPPFGEIIFPEDSQSPISGDVTFQALAEDTALGVASVQFQVQENDVFGNPIGPIIAVGPLIEIFTPANTAGTYQTEIDTTVLDNGFYRISALISDKKTRVLGSSAESSYTKEVSSNYLVSVEN